MKGDQSLSTGQEAGRGEEQVHQMDVPDKVPHAQACDEQMSERSYRRTVGNLTGSSRNLCLKF